MNSHFTYLCVKSYNVNGFHRTGTFLWIAENQRSFFKLLSNLVFCINFLFPYSAEKAIFKIYQRYFSPYPAGLFIPVEKQAAVLNTCHIRQKGEYKRNVSIENWGRNAI